MLFVAAAGNAGVNLGSTPSYPAAYKASNLLSVAASNNHDRLADFSNYGSTVALAAPGVDILSTARGGGYELMSGTSMAVPHVSGAAALVLAKCALDTAQLKAALVNNVDHVGALTGWVATGGRLNVDRAVRSCAAATATSQAPAAPTGVRGISAPGAGQVTLSWSAASGATSYNVKRSYTDGGPYKIVSSPSGTSFVYSGSSGRKYFFVVSAVNAAGESRNSAQVTATGK
jgi:subtilisin family serine protease